MPTTTPENEPKATTDTNQNPRQRKTAIVLWVVQVLLALLFVFAGVMKLVLPLDELAKQAQLPGLFLRFIGWAELAGGLGLILPGLLRIRPGLTPLAAGGLVIIMIGATTLTLIRGPIVTALMPAVVGLLVAFVAYGRWRLAPHRGRSRQTLRQAELRPAG